MGDVICSDGFAGSLDVGLTTAIAVGAAIPLLGEVFKLLGGLKQHVEQFAKQELECTRINVWCTSMMGVLGRLAKDSKSITSDTEDLLNKTTQALQDLVDMVTTRHEKKGIMGGISKFWGSQSYQRKSEHAHLTLDQLIRALQLGLTAETKQQVDILLKRSEVLLKMNVQLDRIDAKLDYIGEGLNKQTAEMRMMHAEMMNALKATAQQQQAVQVGPSDVIADPEAKSFWQRFSLPEVADWRVFKAALQRFDRTLTEEEIENMRTHMDIDNDRRISNVEFNIWCQPSFRDSLAELRRGNMGAINTSLKVSSDLITGAETLPAVDVPVKEGFEYHVFLTHEWGEDEQGRNNHGRVAKLNRYLQGRGLITWFDEDRLEGDIEEEMCEGIDKSQVVLVFVTKRYCDKVTGKDEADYCKKEFKYAVQRKKNLIPIVMEDRMRDTSQWAGTIGMNLGSKKYKVLVQDEGFQEAAETVLQELIKGNL